MKINVWLTESCGDTKTRRRMLLLDQIGLGNIAKRHDKTISLNLIAGYNNICVKSPSIFNAVISAIRNRNYACDKQNVFFLQVGKPKFIRPLYTFKYVLAHLLLQAFPQASFMSILRYVKKWSVDSRRYLDQGDFNYIDFYINFISQHAMYADIYISDSPLIIERLMQLRGAVEKFVYLSRSPYSYRGGTNIVRIYRDSNGNLVANNAFKKTNDKKNANIENDEFFIDYSSVDMGNGLYVFEFYVSVGSLYLERSASMIFASINNINGSQYIQQIVNVDSNSRSMARFKFGTAQFKSGTYLFFLNIANKNSIMRKLKIPIYVKTSQESEVKSYTPYV